ncbi:hypothetical protein ACQEVF_58240 [Nonomuraea polychroma]|uniref:hypothetical protein n=1 Tax=Nonomuraea polychroma TaxID=46176 RepID=UPI003D8E7F2F
MTTSRSLATPPVLAITENPDLIIAVDDICVAAGVHLHVTNAARARPHWASAHLVVVGDDQADTLFACAPPARPHVLLATLRPPDINLWRRAVAVHAAAVLHLPDTAATLATLLTGSVPHNPDPPSPMRQAATS